MKNPEKLIGRKVRGFEFEKINDLFFTERMEKCIDLVGSIEKYDKNDNTFLVRFNKEMGFYYPADQIEAHLVEDEIPTFTKDDLQEAFNVGFSIGRNSKDTPRAFDEWFNIKFKPTKEEQLTAILGSSEKVSEIMELFKKD